MSILALAAGEAYEFPWSRWALLRDCVRHHLDDAATQFPVLGSLGNVMFVGRLEVPPEPLARELAEIHERFAALPIDALVVSPETLGVLFPGSATDRHRTLTEAEQAHFPPRAGNANLAEYFAPLLDCLAQLCGVARKTGVWLELIDR